MGYIPFQELIIYYSDKKDISKLLDNKKKIYIGTKYTIKRENNFFDFLRELNYYSVLDHKCILKLIAYSYSFENGIGYYFVMEKGEDIFEAYKNNKIRIEEICSDLLSAILYINELGIGHFDIKEQNVVYHDGKAKLIDFGLSDRCYPYISYNRDYYCYGNIAYTESFRDPEISDEYNSIRADLYALGMTIYDIYVYKNPRESYNKRKNTFYPPLNIIENKNPILADFIKSCIKPLRHRPSPRDLSNHPIIVRRYQGYKREPVSVHNKCSFDKRDTESASLITLKKNKAHIFSNIVHTIINIAFEYNLKCITLFLAIHILHLVLDKLIPDYEKIQDEKILLFLCVSILYLTSSYHHDVLNIKYILEHDLNMSTYEKDTNKTENMDSSNILNKSAPINFYNFNTKNIKKYDYYDIINLCFGIIGILYGRIDHLTFFDFAQNKTQLGILLHDISECNYSPTFRMRKPEGQVFLRRDIKCSDILDIYKKVPYHIPKQEDYVFPFQVDEPMTLITSSQYENLINEVIMEGLYEYDISDLLEGKEYYIRIPNETKKDFRKVMIQSNKGKDILKVLESK